MKNKLGVSTGCYYPMLSETVIEQIAQTGANVIELFINTHSEMEIGYIKEIKSIIDSYGLSVCSVHPFTSFAESYLFFSDYPRRTEDGLKIYDRYFDICNLLGANVLNFHGLKAEKQVSFEKYCQVYSGLFERAKKHGVVFSQENVRQHVCGNLDFIKRFSDQLGNNVAFTFDIKQAVMYGYDPLTFSVAVADKLALVHLNDYDKNASCLLPGKGAFDYKQFFSMLKSVGYNGNFIIEVYSDAYSANTEISDSVKYAVSVMKECFL